jgi:hypothetical protein
MPTKRCTEADRGGRLAKALQFLEAAELVEAPPTKTTSSTRS